MNETTKNERYASKTVTSVQSKNVVCKIILYHLQSRLQSPSPSLHKSEGGLPLCRIHASLSSGCSSVHPGDLFRGDPGWHPEDWHRTACWSLLAGLTGAASAMFPHQMCFIHRRMSRVDVNLAPDHFRRYGPTHRAGQTLHSPGSYAFVAEDVVTS